jgi:hypothetical protein
MKIITLEEHFVTPEYLEATSAPSNPGSFGHYPAALQERLLDLGEKRIADMDAAGVDVQVLSLAAIGMDALASQAATALARATNDRTAEAVQAYPGRFAAFATLGLQEPAKAAEELRRCITDLGFKGVMVNGTTGGLFLDDPSFEPVLEAAHALDVPIYIHPAPPPAAVRDAYYENLPGNFGQLLSIAGWGWHVETGLHVLRLIVSGAFDRYPNLQVIIGHMGENLPFSIARASAVLSQNSGFLKRSVADYFRSHFFLTTSGYFTLPPFLCALMVVGADRLLFSVDYPFSPNERGVQFLNSLPVSDEDREKIAHGNAARLLKL